MRSRILSLWLPYLATERLRNRARARSSGHVVGEAAPPGLDPDRPLVTFEHQKGALRVRAVCPHARDAGLTPGMMLADARAMVPELQVHPAEPDADARLLARLVTWCERYTPYAAVDDSDAHGAGGGLWLDITGCTHLFATEAAANGSTDGEAGLRADLLARLERQGLSAAAAIADTPGAAWAAARYGEPEWGSERAILPPDGARVALAGLPVAGLRLAPDVVRMLTRLGLTRIEQLYPLPRAALMARFGEPLMTRLDQALGRTAEPISPVRPLPAHRAQMVFAEPITHGETLPPVTERLVDQLCRGLAAASLGARRLVLAFYRVDASTVTVAVGTSRPCADRNQLIRLLAEKLDRIDLGFGVERVVLEAVGVELLVPEPLAWRAMGAGDLDQARDLAPLVDRLSNRLGGRAVAQLVPQASHLPERAQRRIPALSRKQPPPFAAPEQRPGGAPTRPLRLLSAPEPIEAMAPLPDDPPVLFRWRRVLHRVKSVRGPERIAPEWWRTPEVAPDAGTRDYFAVEDEDGGRFWLFREGLYLATAANGGGPTPLPVMPRWYLHGLFA